MQQLTACLIAAGIGAITGVVQWYIFMRNPSLKRTFSEHLADLRWHWLIAGTVMVVFSVLVAFVQNRLDLLKWALTTFMLSWFGVMGFHAWRFLKIPNDIDSKQVDLGEAHMDSHQD